MAQNKHLQAAIRQMADGSKSGFHTFYLGSVQFIYSSALLLYGDHKKACGFLVDFYQYLYLHLPEYTPSQDLEKWISRLIMERYSQLSIGRDVKQPSVRAQMGAGTALLEASERERVWRLLEERMHFPAEPPKKRDRTGALLVVTVMLLAALLAFHYREPLIEGLQDALAQPQDADGGDKTEGTDGADMPSGDPAAGLPSAGDTTSLEINNVRQTDFGTEGSAPEIEPPTVDAPKAPDVPGVQTPSADPPDVPDVQEPAIDPPTAAGTPSGGQENSSGNPGSVDLENYELNLFYGDSLTDQ